MLEATVRISDIKATLDQYVLGQEKAKEELSKAFWLHLYQYITEKKHGRIERKQYIHPHILFTGPTGSGKTELVTALSEEYGWPMVTIDMSVLTPSGYVGSSLSEIIYNEVEHLMDKGVKNYEYLIIFCDEFDKVVGEDGGDRDVRAFKRSIQYEFLKLIETGVLDTGDSGSPSKPKKEPMDLSRAIFVMAGNFPDMRKDNIKSNIGFGNELKEDLNKGLSAVEKLTKLGLASQLAGRISFIAELERLTEDQLTDIVNGKHLVAAGIYSLAEAAKITITDSMKHDSIKHALKTNTGARGLKLPLISSILDKLYHDEVFINLSTKANNATIRDLESTYRTLIEDRDNLRIMINAWNERIRILKQDRNKHSNNSEQLKKIVDSINELKNSLQNVKEELIEVNAQLTVVNKKLTAEYAKLKNKSILGK